MWLARVLLGCWGALPMNAPEPRSSKVDIYMFVDSNNTWDEVPCRSRGDFLIYLNIALFQWFSKKPSAVEISVFGANVVDMKHDKNAPTDLDISLEW